MNTEWKEQFLALLLPALLAGAQLATAGPPGVTSLTNKATAYHLPAGHSVDMHRGPIRIVVVDNSAVGSEHREGYNGMAVLSHKKRRENLFVPLYSGLNLEVIHDGTNAPREVLFEPRRAPMELRVLTRHAVELYQAPTPNWRLESCTRFELEKDGTVHMIFECIPRARVFKYGYVGLFWASYIHQPESPAIHFLGHEVSGGPERWIEAVSPRHGVEATHISEHDQRDFAQAADFQSRYQIFAWSKYVHTKPFYYGLSHGMAYVVMFRPADGIRFTQSPSGGGREIRLWISSGSFRITGWTRRTVLRCEWLMCLSGVRSRSRSCMSARPAGGPGTADGPRSSCHRTLRSSAGARIDCPRSSSSQEFHILEQDFQLAFPVRFGQQLVAGQERVLWNPALSIPGKEFDFADTEVARMKVAMEMWNHYSATADRRWLEPLVDEFLSAEPR